MTVTYRCWRCAASKRTAGVIIESPSLAEAERIAQEEGWKKDRHRWLCPACARPTIDLIARLREVLADCRAEDPREEALGWVDALAGEFDTTHAVIIRELDRLITTPPKGED